MKSNKQLNFYKKVVAIPAWEREGVLPKLAVHGMSGFSDSELDNFTKFVVSVETASQSCLESAPCTVFGTLLNPMPSIKKFFGHESEPNPDEKIMNDIAKEYQAFCDRTLVDKAVDSCVTGSNAVLGTLAGNFCAVPAALAKCFGLSKTGDVLSRFGTAGTIVMKPATMLLGILAGALVNSGLSLVEDKWAFGQSVMNKIKDKFGEDSTTFKVFNRLHQQGALKQFITTGAMAVANQVPIFDAAHKADAQYREFILDQLGFKVITEQPGHTSSVSRGRRDAGVNELGYGDGLVPLNLINETLGDGRFSGDTSIGSFLTDQVVTATPLVSSVREYLEPLLSEATHGAVTLDLSDIPGAELPGATLEFDQLANALYKTFNPLGTTCPPADALAVTRAVVQTFVHTVPGLSWDTFPASIFSASPFVDIPVATDINPRVFAHISPNSLFMGLVASRVGMAPAELLQALSIVTSGGTLDSITGVQAQSYVNLLSELALEKGEDQTAIDAALVSSNTTHSFCGNADIPDYKSAVDPTSSGSSSTASLGGPVGGGVGAVVLIALAALVAKVVYNRRHPIQRHDAPPRPIDGGPGNYRNPLGPILLHRAAWGEGDAPVASTLANPVVDDPTQGTSRSIAMSLGEEE